MESSEFDAAIGGMEHLPFSANSLKFAVSRSVEIAAMTESIVNPTKTKQIFQTLPVHMRRRVMSHNCKRLPRKLRVGHLEQLKKSGLPPKQKRPSRKYRRRPTNLLEEYNRRQKRNIWLETHIWHAKRFHMIERWGYRLAYAPCDKAFRACYRATSAHCLLQDISYYTSIEIVGTEENIKHIFKHITNEYCGLNITAKAYTNCEREGMIHIYNKNQYPFGYVGKINFMWVCCSNKTKNLWLFVHPSYAKQVESLLHGLISADSNFVTNSTYEKRRKLMHNQNTNVEIKVHGLFNRFRLTGPNSHAVLVKTLECIDKIEKIKENSWVSCLNNQSLLALEEKHNYWDNISLLSSPSQLPASLIIGLIVRDPRLNRPKHRTKAQADRDKTIKTEYLVNIPVTASISPLWDTSTNIHESIKEKKLSNAQFIQHITKTQLVPGEICKDDPALQSIPVVLIQRPGSQEPRFKNVGYGCGWDIIVPSGYGLPFWQTFIMFGARSGGLRESENLAFEMGECYLPPDSSAGKLEEETIRTELKEKYFSLPPNKRVNYTKLAVNSPFICPWKILLQDWSGNTVENIFVLRNKGILTMLQDCLHKKNEIPQIENAGNCLVAVFIVIKGKGKLKRHAHICLPLAKDLLKNTPVFEPNHNDPNESLRKTRRAEHKKEIKCWRRKQIKLKKRETLVKKKIPRKVKHEPSQYVKEMRELWLPSNIQTVRNSASREILGFLSQGAFSFSEARSCGVGYIAFNSLSVLSGLNKVLVRNTTSRKYCIADVQIIKKV